MLLCFYVNTFFSLKSCNDHLNIMVYRFDNFNDVWEIMYSCNVEIGNFFQLSDNDGCCLKNLNLIFFLLFSSKIFFTSMSAALVVCPLCFTVYYLFRQHCFNVLLYIDIILHVLELCERIQLLGFFLLLKYLKKNSFVFSTVDLDYSTFRNWENYITI